MAENSTTKSPAPSPCQPRAATLRGASYKSAAWFGLDTARADGVASDGLVAPGSYATFRARVYQPFKSERLCVARACASDFAIAQVFVGCMSARPSPNLDLLPTEPFAANLDALPDVAFDGQRLTVSVPPEEAALLGGPFPMATAHAGIDLTFTVMNVGRERRRFFGALLGQMLL